MADVPSAPNLEDAVNLYIEGVPYKTAAQRSGIGKRHLASVLHERGLMRAPRGRLSLPDEQIVARYEAGESEKSIADSLGIFRPAVRRRLEEAGVRLRGIAEANQLVMDGRSPEDRRRNAEAANAAARGRVVTLEEKCKAAATRQRLVIHDSPYERRLVGWLEERGVRCVPQQACGPYNIDIGIHPVAVEVVTGTTVDTIPTAQHCPQRLRHILDRGWAMIMVRVRMPARPLTEGAAEYVAAFLQRVHANPTLRGQYRVIWGNGELAPQIGCDRHDFAIVEARRARLDAPGLDH